MRTNRVFVPFSLQISPVSGEEGSHINIWSSLFTDAVRKPDVPHLKKNEAILATVQMYFLTIRHIRTDGRMLR